MKFTYKWLKEYVDIEYKVEEILKKLTFRGLSCESYEDLQKNFEKVIVGEVIDCKKHPEAEKLSICQVNTGNEILQIVCGAPNVAKGQKVALALIGAKLGELAIKKAKIRGIESFGMICAEDELGLGDDHSGIMVLPENSKVGVNLAEALNLEDYCIDLEITPNRPDCLSVIGIAREVSLIVGNSYKKPNILLEENENEKVNDYAKVIVENPKKCPRYAARIVKNVKIAPSPLWLQNRLKAIGLRPINNVVDVTNYVMYEYGHPIHAFDLNKLSNNTIIVREAYKGEKFVTLDGKEIELDGEELMIADSEKSVALAGVMGGSNSCIDDNTTSILIECAYFEPTSIRKTSKKFSISTDSSYRFERGVDPNAVPEVINRVAQLVKMTAGGEILKGMIDIYPNVIECKKIELRLKRVNSILGCEIEREKIESILKGLEFKYDRISDDKLLVYAPTFRPDIEREIDLIEEIARIYGYENIPLRSTYTEMLEIETNKNYELRKKISRILVDLGFYETISSSFIGLEILDKLMLPPDDRRRKLIRILNPKREEEAYMRTMLFQNLLNIAVYNYNREYKNGRFFEIGRVYLNVDEVKNNIYSEEINELSGIMYGRRYEQFWNDNPVKYDFFDVKAIIENILDRIYINKYELVRSTSPYFHPGQSADIICNNTKIGEFGLFHPDINEKFDINEKIWGFSLNLTNIVDIIDNTIYYKELVRLPSSQRDISFLIDENITYEEIKKELENISKKNSIEKVNIIDLFKSEKLPEGKKSICISIIYKNKERTLTDNEVNKYHENVTNTLRNKFNIELR